MTVLIAALLILVIFSLLYLSRSVERLAKRIPQGEIISITTTHETFRAVKLDQIEEAPRSFTITKRRRQS